MSEPIRKPGQQPAPESYDPREVPEIMRALGETRSQIEEPVAAPALERFEIVKFGPYKFVGKSVYARSGVMGDVFGGLYRSYGPGIFETLDSMKEYATDETYCTALYQWKSPR